jgi:hypothetical protein
MPFNKNSQGSFVYLFFIYLFIIKHSLRKFDREFNNIIHPNLNKNFQEAHSDLQNRNQMLDLHNLEEIIRKQPYSNFDNFSFLNQNKNNNFVIPSFLQKNFVPPDKSRLGYDNTLKKNDIPSNSSFPSPVSLSSPHISNLLPQVLSPNNLHFSKLAEENIVSNSFNENNNIRNTSTFVENNKIIEDEINFMSSLEKLVDNSYEDYNDFF